jgi:hypothetical protein
MNTFLSIIGVGALIWLVFAFTKYKGEKIQEHLERAYFEGQKDALQGDIRIKRNNDSCWIWIKSPWNSGEEPIFVPNKVCQ